METANLIASYGQPNRKKALSEQLRVVLPAAFAVILFVSLAFGVFLPTFRASIMERKKEMLKQLVSTAYSVLTHDYELAQQGRLSQDEAQARAIQELRAMRYGRENKDYFWINDMQPKMVMHPYRADLEGKDLSNFADPQGNHLFVNFVKLVKDQGQGFSPYVWQWNDDPQRIVSKLSYIREFAPWGWIVGTGIYLDDVEQQVYRLSRNMAGISGGGFVLILLIALYSVRHGLIVTKQRQQAVAELQKYHGQLEQLVEQRTNALAEANQKLENKIAQLEKTTKEKEQLISELTEAKTTVKSLVGLLPICASCKKVRNEEGQWETVEHYVSQRSEADFSHSICPDCADKLYYSHLPKKSTGKASSL